MKMPKGRREFTHCRNKLLQEKKIQWGKFRTSKLFCQFDRLKYCIYFFLLARAEQKC